MELSKKPELLKVTSECLSVHVVVGSEVNRVLELCISNSRLRIIIAGLDDNTHVCLSDREDLLVIFLATGTRNDPERDTDVVPGISLDSLVCRNVDRFDYVRGIGTSSEGKMDALSELARWRVVSVNLHAIEGV